MTKQLRLFFPRTGEIEKHAAAREQLFALACQQKPASDTIKKPQAEFALESTTACSRSAGTISPSIVATSPPAAVIWRNACARIYRTWNQYAAKRANYASDRGRPSVLPASSIKWN
jgi:hypothetical protein